MQALDRLLFKESAIEQQQKKTGQLVPDFQEIEQQTPHLTNDLFFKNKDIYISKHSRYAPYPLHSHQFLELNYVYKGQCKQIIDGREHLLQEGDLLLMDIGSQHQIASLGQGDIVINILFKNTDLSLQSLNYLQSQYSILYHMLLHKEAAGLADNHHLIIRKKESAATLPLLHQMMMEYFFPKDFSQDILHHYLAILLLELSRSLPTVQEQGYKGLNKSLVKVLELIDQDYQELSLEKAAQQLGFNKNYLSNLVKQESQQTFTDLLNQKKLMMAKQLLTTTDFSIETICHQVGFSNKTYFYKKYQELFQERPSQTRQSS